MDKQEVIAMLKSLIANVEADHVTLAGVATDADADSMILQFSGVPQIGRIYDNPTY